MSAVCAHADYTFIASAGSHRYRSKTDIWEWYSCAMEYEYAFYCIDIDWNDRKRFEREWKHEFEGKRANFEGCHVICYVGL
jgi:hypothetical protein